MKEKIVIKNYRNFDPYVGVTLELSKENIFILGKNNIGKSNVLRFFYEFRACFRDWIDVKSVMFNTELPNSFKSCFANLLNVKYPGKPIVVEFHLKTQIQVFHFEKISESHETARMYLDKEKSTYDESDFEENTNQLILEKSTLFSELFNNSMYIGGFRGPSNTNGSKMNDVTLGHDFISIWQERSTGVNRLYRNEISSLTKTMKCIFGFEELSILASKDHRTLFIENENGSFSLDELGGGIAQIIYILGNATFQKPKFILIDEPESSLHPQMQIEFFETLQQKAENGVIATSHSIGLARSCGDSIYHLMKRNNNLRLERFDNNFNMRDAISELGYSQFTEVGGKNILLVEGPTDIKCYREILRKYGLERFFIIMNLGGGSGIQSKAKDSLEEIQRLEANSYSVIIDSEKDSEDWELSTGTIKDFKDTCEELNFNVFLTEYHSTENYITQDALNKISGESKYKECNKFENFTKRKDEKWSKSSNWKYFTEMSKEDFSGTELEKFISDTLKPLIKET